MTTPPRYCQAAPVTPNDPLVWKGSINDITPWNSCKHLLDITLPTNYPFRPPQFKLYLENSGATKNNSTNNNRHQKSRWKFADMTTGQIDLDALGVNWHPGFSLPKLFVILRAALIPNHNKAITLAVDCSTARYCVPVELRAIILQYMLTIRLDNSLFRQALGMWFSDEPRCLLIYGHISKWDTSLVTNMSNISFGPHFNEDLNDWDVSGVTTMEGMFKQASSFNQPLYHWDVNQVINMKEMFLEASEFNQSLDSWNVCNVTNITGMFSHADIFNQPLNQWNVSNVVNMKDLFLNATKFNQPLDQWNVSSVCDMSGMFSSANRFNQPLSTWNVSKVKTMRRMFGASARYRSGLHYLLSSGTDRVLAFNQPLKSWNVSNVTDMNYMFYGNAVFNQVLDNWNVTSVTTMFGMFMKASKFNQPLHRWNVSNVTNMTCMFCAAKGFNQSLQQWNVTNVVSMRSMFYDIPHYRYVPRNWNPDVLQSPAFFPYVLQENLGNDLMELQDGLPDDFEDLDIL